METITRNIQDLLAFHMVAKEGSFTKASEILGVSKSMLSKQVRRLEAYTKTNLFHRTTRTLYLTDEGKSLLNYSQKIFDLSEESERSLREMSQGSVGELRISAPNSLGELIFNDLLPELKKKLPRTRFDFDLSNMRRNFLADKVDFALRAIEVTHPDLVAKYLGHIKDVICASPDFMKKNKLSEPKEIESVECIVHSLNPDWNKWCLTSQKSEIHIEVSGTTATNQYSATRTLCLLGYGVARIPYYLVKEDIESGALVHLFPQYSIATHPLYFAYLRSDYMTKRHKIAKDMILGWIKQKSEIFI